jgi:hypothetical protein
MPERERRHPNPHHDTPRDILESQTLPPRGKAKASVARILTTLTLWAIQAIPTSLDFLTKMFNQAQTPSMSTYS